MKIIETEEKVVVKKKKIFIADDGTEFKTLTKCEEYEKAKEEKEKITRNVKSARCKFKFNSLKLYDCMCDDFYEYDAVYVESKEELETNAIDCYYPEKRYGYNVSIETYDNAEYPCWFIIKEVDMDSSIRFATPMNYVLQILKEDIDSLENILKTETK